MSISDTAGGSKACVCVFADSPEETLTPDRIASAKNLGPEQRAAVDAAAALASLMEAIEAPYREWITGDTNVRLDRSVLDLPGWQHADDWKERDLQHLQRLLEAEASLRLCAESSGVARPAARSTGLGSR